MRRKKRDKITRAFTRGYQTGVHRKSKELCPYKDSESRQSWINGWRVGKEDSWDGLTGMADLIPAPAEQGLNTYQK